MKIMECTREKRWWEYDKAKGETLEITTFQRLLKRSHKEDTHVGGKRGVTEIEANPVGGATDIGC